MSQMASACTATIPLHRVAVLQPFTSFLAEVGTPVERELRLAGLPVFALEDMNNFVPSHQYWNFLVNTSHREGIQNLGFHVGKKYGANCADPHLHDLLHRFPTVFQSLLKACELTNKTVSNCTLGILHLPRSKYAHFYHHPSCEAKNPAIHQIGWFGVMTLIGMVRECIGPHWQPVEIGLMTNDTPSPDILEQFPCTRIRLSQPYSYISLERALLCLPPLSPVAAESACSLLEFECLPKDFVGSVERVLRSYITEGHLSLEVIATLCDMSKRSVQRKLAAKDVRYSEILEEVRFDAATQMLKDPARTVAETSHALGYGHPTHFSRAFRHIAGVSPREYRRLQALNAGQV